VSEGEGGGGAVTFPLLKFWVVRKLSENIFLVEIILSKNAKFGDETLLHFGEI